MSKFYQTAKNVKTALLNPVLISQYINYSVQRLLLKRMPVRKLAEGIRVGNVVGFSEFHSVEDFVSSSELALFKSLQLSPGIILDIGANIGVVSLYFEKIFPKNKIYAIEPNPSTYAALVDNMNRFGSGNTTTINTAFADRDGSMLFDASATHRGTASFYTQESTSSTEVRTTRLDTFVEQIGNPEVSLLKIDVEGYEDLVYSGGLENLKTLPSCIYMEVCPRITIRAGYAPELALVRLERLGYKLSRIGKNGELIGATASELVAFDYLNCIATI